VDHLLCQKHKTVTLIVPFPHSLCFAHKWHGFTVQVDQDLQSDDERTLNFILEHKLFICQPRRGHLEVGEEVDVVLSYRHNFPTAEFRISIVLAVCEMSPGGGVHNTGKQVVANSCNCLIPKQNTSTLSDLIDNICLTSWLSVFQIVLALIGQTLQPGEPYLHLPVADPRFFRHNVRLNPQVEMFWYKCCMQS
jgi:hypothetical protein